MFPYTQLAGHKCRLFVHHKNQVGCSNMQQYAAAAQSHGPIWIIWVSPHEPQCLWVSHGLSPFSGRQVADTDPIFRHDLCLRKQPLGTSGTLKTHQDPRWKSSRCYGSWLESRPNSAVLGEFRMSSENTISCQL